MEQISYIYVSENSVLRNLIANISNQDLLYIDLEFDKNHFRYGFNLCLVQIFHKDKCYLIDPLTDLSINELFPIFENEEIKKVCFSFGEDLRLLHYLGCFPKNCVDLAVARSLLNKPVISLSKLIAEDLGIEVGASQQKSNWFTRPLSEKQCQYAAEDVVFLPSIYEKLIQELKILNRTSWFQEEMMFFSSQDFSKEPVGFQLRNKDKKQFSPSQWNDYKKLVQFREKLAQDLDRPSYKVVGTDYLIKIAKEKSLINEWLSNKNVHPKLRNNKVKKQLEDELKKDIKIDSHPRDESDFLLQKQSYQKKKELVNKWKESFFMPVRELFLIEFGESFTNYVFSKRKIEAVIKGDQILLDYQKEIVKTFGKRLKLTIPSFL